MVSRIRSIWQHNQWLLIVTGWVIGILTFPFIESLGAGVANFIQDLLPEAVGILFTVLIIDRLDARRELEQLQNRLVREATGQSNEMSRAALDWMQFEGWLAGDDSLLAGQEASRANMDGVNLVEANLERTDFYKSSLIHANIYGAHARNTNFAYTNLEGADFIHANLTGANLEGAILEGALFFHPNQAPAVMPDGAPWTPETDIRRFTDHTHPNFWRSNDSDSYAYIGLENHWAKQRTPESSRR